MDSLGVVGLGVIPVGMRRVLGVDTSFTSVDAFREEDRHPGLGLGGGEL